jgi:predicted SnoaL-like aldol condensation-catalyzing enzyme
MWKKACLIAALSIAGAHAARAETATTPTLQAVPTTPEAAKAQKQREERNKAAAIAFYKTQNTQDWAAARKFLGDKWIEHNTHAPDGIEGLEKLYRSLRERTPEHRSVIRRAFAQGDLVVLHINDLAYPDVRGTALIAFFRFENDKIVEHWDVKQDIPGLANYNSMF